MNGRRIYVASSWRNLHQPQIVTELREAGHLVYDFRNPPGRTGFEWSEIDPEWLAWSLEEYRQALEHPISQAGFASDFNAMKWADTCVLVLPCGRSAHLEAGYFTGAGKQLLILLPDEQEPELMYLMADHVCLSVPELLGKLAAPMDVGPGDRDGC